MQHKSTRTLRPRDIWMLGGFLLVCFSVAAAGGAITATSVNDWYQTLDKPGFTPPDWLFAPVWTALYALMAIAGWRVWRACGFRASSWALAAFAAQLALNLGWSILFFGLNLVGVALAEMVVLLGVILLTAFVFFRRDRLAGVLFAPYAAWVGYALLLNASIWVLN